MYVRIYNLVIRIVNFRGDFMKKLVIDLGHGGNDPGAIGQGGTHEADIVLDIGQEIEILLKGYKVDYKFTRLTNKSVSLLERCRIANGFNADYFVSIHINSASDKSVRGVEVFKYSNSNGKINKFCDDVCRDISKQLSIRNRGSKIGNQLYVVKNTKMPAALIEVDFISNKDCERDLNDLNNIKQLSKIIFDRLIDMVGLETKDDRLYRVCIGAYRDKNNAVKQLEIAKNKGFKDSYII